MVVLFTVDIVPMEVVLLAELLGCLYPPDNATYGLETVALGISNATAAPTLADQVVALFIGISKHPRNFPAGSATHKFHRSPS